MVDGVTRHPDRYLRNIEDIFGDMSSAALAQRYSKWTCFHAFVEELISSVIFEDAEIAERSPGEYWVDYLLQSNSFDYSSITPSKFGRFDGYEYLDALQQEDLITELCETISKQVFYVLFSNRGTMSAFGHMVRSYVLETAPSFVPEAFNDAGHLIRASIPKWAENAVFHRDKGRCVLCQTDLTKLFSQQSQIHYDHIIPLAHGGMNCITNLQLTCSSCNLSKGARSAATSREYEVWYDY
ncbi:HNH endonuclease [Cohaesibacter sp. ES.047]|uniref:HNH endonuclease n=1 Tax=Cohaesibacter sp. ES.047 TaxID=1798205 RepID=UPI00352A9BA2